ncbi:MAG: hypothetical protein NC253_05275 [Ruminococcus sp.]|nr:hypothetical protein [Ruminococcus sp.]MCM1380328.1 hypothetical protein [Muribaculaceae bacterium]MCM1478240.1 hypothetical protein [Muribaculaceae bacterium]
MYVVFAATNKINNMGKVYGVYKSRAAAEKAAKEYNISDLCAVFKDPREIIETEYVYTVWYDPTNDPYYDGDPFDEYRGEYATMQDAQNACENGGYTAEKRQLSERDCADCANDDDLDWFNAE